MKTVTTSRAYAETQMVRRTDGSVWVVETCTSRGDGTYRVTMRRYTASRMASGWMSR